MVSDGGTVSALAGLPKDRRGEGLAEALVNEVEFQLVECLESWDYRRLRQSSTDDQVGVERCWQNREKI